MDIDRIINSVLNKKYSDRFEKRINYLKYEKQLETTQIENGIKQVSDVLSSGGKSFVIYGEPQSGKTEMMIALTCKLLDDGYKTIFVVMNDNTELENQNFNRFRTAPELNTSPLRDAQLQSMEVDDLKSDKIRVIFCRKNKNNLEKLIENCRYIKGERVLIDDEADYATPNAKINKDEITTINNLVGKLSDVESEGIYIGVTATPGRLDLNNTYLNNSKDWVFLESYPEYKGRAFFFPITADDISRSDYILTKLPDEGDQPALLRTAIYRFLIRVAILNLSKEHNYGNNFSMLIHTAGQTNDHIEDEKSVNKVLRTFNIEDGVDSNKKKAIESLHGEAEKILKDLDEDISAAEVVEFVLDNISHNEVLIINHKKDKQNVIRSCDPESKFVFAIGGNIVSRGLTFNNLLSFFFSRNVKNKLQQNTYIQRARMFGNRPYSKFFELMVPETLFQNWADTFAHHELSLEMARSGDYIHFQGKKTSAGDSASIDKSNIMSANGERAAGAKFELTPQFIDLINEPHEDIVSHLKEMKKQGHIPDSAIPDSIFGFIEKTSIANVSLCKLVLHQSSEDGILNITERQGHDEEEIYTQRGGIIDTIINKRQDFYGYLHYIMPIKNSRNEVRFYLRSMTGHQILENVINRKK